MTNILFRIDQFNEWYAWMVCNSPKNYLPCIIPIKKNGKEIDTLEIYKRVHKCNCGHSEWVRIKISEKKSKMRCKLCKLGKASWKQRQARLNNLESVEWIKLGGNVGVVAEKNSPLTLIDIDALKYYNQMPNTLTTLSRKRAGGHGFVWNQEGIDKIPNIATENYGEVRSQDQYVLIPGSYVSTTKEDIDAELKEGNITEAEHKQILSDNYLGYYTVNNKREPATITFNDLPQFFKDEYLKQETDNKKADRSHYNNNVIHIEDKDRTALFNITMDDIMTLDSSLRVKHPCHDSATDANFSIDDKGLARCWRHSVSLNAYQFLVVKSGYMSCLDAGSSSTKTSKVKGDAGALFHAWLEAKKMGLLPDNDPIPLKAMRWLAVKHKLLDTINSEITYKIYNKVIELVESDY